MTQPITPVVVGVGDIVNRSIEVKDAIEPRALILDAIRQAVRDARPTHTQFLQASIDSIDVVASWTWPYEDLPGLLSKDLQIEARHKYIPTYHGGNQPAKLLDDAAKRVSLGLCKVAVVCGGEALASLTACAKAKILPPPGWTVPKQNVDSVFTPTNRKLEEGLGSVHEIGAPIHVYPLYENGFRAYRNQSLHDNNVESADLYANFARIAEHNPNAWSYGRPAATPQQIGKVSKHNRMICLPYPLLMNAFNTINIAGACILTSTEYARELGISEARWIYPLGGAGTRDSYNFWERPDFHSSPCISRSIDTALRVSGLEKDDIDLYDFYSCFPIVPKLACAHLGLSITNPEKPISLLGGLTSFGGAGNNYSMHALTEMVRQLRNGTGRNGLVLANGGVITYQHVICLSSKPGQTKSYPVADALPPILTDVMVPEVELKPLGEAVVETYTVEFARDGGPLRGYIVGKLKNGKRFLANHADALTLSQLASTTNEPIGKTGRVWRDTQREGRNLFSFAKDAKL